MTMAMMPARGRVPRRLAMVSVHTSPLDQPGTGDAGGMNVYVVELARRLAALGVEVDIITRATSSRPAADASSWRPASPSGTSPPARSRAWPRRTCPPSCARSPPGVMRSRPPGRARLVRPRALPLLALRPGRPGWPPSGGTCRSSTRCTRWPRSRTSRWPTVTTPEPAARAIGEAQVVDAADRLVANTDEEGRQLVELYDADPDRVAVVPPGVDLELFSSRSARGGSCAGSALPADAVVLLFVGRIQPLKAPDVLLRAAARLRRGSGRSCATACVVAVVGGPSGSGLAHPEALHSLATELGLLDLVRFVPPVPQDRLPDWYRAADVTVVPSYSESFGLVAIESQACGTPVVAAAVGGLRTAVADGVSGVLRRRSRPAGLRRGPRRPARRPGPAGRAEPGCPAARRPVQLGSDRGGHARGLLRGAAASARAAPRSPSTGEPGAGRRCRGPARRPGRARARGAHARARSSSCSRARKSSRRRAQPGRRRAQPVGQRVRRPAPGREPRGRLPVAARAQHEACTPWRSPSTTSATSTSAAASRCTPSRPTRSTGCSVRCSTRPTPRSTPSSSWASPRRSARSGPGGISRGEPTWNLQAFQNLAPDAVQRDAD